MPVIFTCKFEQKKIFAALTAAFDNERIASGVTHFSKKSSIFLQHNLPLIQG